MLWKIEHFLLISEMMKRQNRNTDRNNNPKIMKLNTHNDTNNAYNDHNRTSVREELIATTPFEHTHTYAHTHTHKDDTTQIILYFVF